MQSGGRNEIQLHRIKEPKLSLNENQIASVWERRIGSEVRSLYFGDLANIDSRVKQILNGSIFFLSSGAAATVIAKMNPSVPIILSLLVACASAYTIAVNLDAKIRTMAKLHYSWNQLASEYERLWDHNYEDDAEDQLNILIKREEDLSEVATTDAPNDQKKMGYWQDWVQKRYDLTAA